MLAVTTTPNMPIIFTVQYTTECRLQQIRRAAFRDLQESMENRQNNAVATVILHSICFERG